MSYQIVRTDGAYVATVLDDAVNTQALPITLFGKGFTNYGASLNENFVALLENFSGPNVPQYSTPGMLWFDATHQTLRVVNTNQVWHTLAYTDAGDQSFNGGLNVAGDIIAGGNITQHSDARLKTNVRPIDDALKLVQDLRGVRYTRLADEHNSIGVIAQEVQEVLPELVAEGWDGILSVAYGNMTGVLIEAIKALTARVEQLEAKLACQDELLSIHLKELNA